jgi:hypothetical protein
MKELLFPIDTSLGVLSAYVTKNNLTFDEWPYREILFVLTLIKEKIMLGEQLHTRLLRAMKDVYIIAFRNFEGTLLYDEIDNLDNRLRSIVNDYEKLQPLGMEFGKEYPI